jgi:heat shock protein HslJ
MKKLVILTLILLALTACTVGAAPSLTGSWKLVSYGPVDTQTPAMPDVDTTIEFKDGQISANVGCNGIGGEYVVDGTGVTFDKMISTMMFCEGQVGEQEMALIGIMNGTASFTLTDTTLTITSADGLSALVLEKK